MVGFLIIGEEPSTIPHVVDIISTSSSFPTLCTRLEMMTGVLRVRKSCQDLHENKKNDRTLLLDILFKWKKKQGNLATLEDLYTALCLCNIKSIADLLWYELTKILKDFLKGNAIKNCDIFMIPSVFIQRPKQNDPFVLRKPFYIPNKFVFGNDIGSFFEQYLLKLWKENQLQMFERHSFKKLSLHHMAQTMLLNQFVGTDKAQELFEKINLTNYGTCYFLWFMIARTVLKTRMDDPWRINNLLMDVFEFEVEEDFLISPKFKHEFLIFFIDWFVGMSNEKEYECYQLPALNFEQHRLIRYTIACFNAEAFNLLKHVYSNNPLILHSLVQDTTSLDTSQLEVRKALISNIIRNNPDLVDYRNDNGLPPVLLQYIHVDLIKLVIGTNAFEVDHELCNFVHRAAQYLPSEQFEQLVGFLMDTNLAELLNTTDSGQRTPLLICINKIYSHHDFNLLHLLSMAGANFSIKDSNGRNCLWYAVSWNKSVDILKELVSIGADWRCKDNSNATLLHHAAQQGNLDTVKYFIKLGLHINVSDNNLNTPLNFAVTGRNNVEVVKFLLAYGADLNTLKKEDYSTLQWIRGNI